MADLAVAWRGLSPGSRLSASTNVIMEYIRNGSLEEGVRQLWEIAYTLGALEAVERVAEQDASEIIPEFKPGDLVVVNSRVVSCESYSRELFPYWTDVSSEYVNLHKALSGTPAMISRINPMQRDHRIVIEVPDGLNQLRKLTVAPYEITLRGAVEPKPVESVRKVSRRFDLT